MSTRIQTLCEELQAETSALSRALELTQRDAKDQDARLTELRERRTAEEQDCDVVHGIMNEQCVPGHESCAFRVDGFIRGLHAGLDRAGIKRMDSAACRIGLLAGYAGQMAGTEGVHALLDGEGVPEMPVCADRLAECVRALHHSLGIKVPTLTVKPAYSSQTCPSCGCVSRSNRSGIKFHCRSCGRKSHADVIGGINLLGRSEDKQVGLGDHPSVVKALLREQYRARRRDSSPGDLAVTALAPSTRRLTTSVPKEGAGTASNRVEAHTQV